MKKFIASIIMSVTVAGTASATNSAGWDPTDKQEIFNILMIQAMDNPEWDEYTGNQSAKIINCLNDYYEPLMDYMSYRWKLAPSASFEDKRELSNVITRCKDDVTKGINFY